MLSKSDVVSILQAQLVMDENGNRLTYPKEKCRFIIDAMSNFKLCYCLPEDSRYFVIPDKLPKEQPNLSDHFNKNAEGTLVFEFNFSKLTELSRDEWNKLVNQFINTPATVTQSAIDTFVPGGSDDPRKFKDVKGRIVIIGPNLPAGKKISGHERAKVEVFRGAMRPFATTINQELSDVLKSNVRAFLILPGTVDGKEPNDENIMNTINYLMSDESQSSSEVIFCPDETR